VVAANPLPAPRKKYQKRKLKIYILNLKNIYILIFFVWYFFLGAGDEFEAATREMKKIEEKEEDKKKDKKEKELKTRKKSNK